MTAQVGDRFIYDKKDYSFVAISNPSILKELYTNVEKFVEVSFSKDMATKAWWIR